MFLADFAHDVVDTFLYLILCLAVVGRLLVKAGAGGLMRDGVAELVKRFLRGR